MAVYWQRGPAVFEAFWFANFASVTLRKGYPAAKHAYENSEAKRSSWFWRMWS